MTDKKLSALECATPEQVIEQHAQHHEAALPCALLCPTTAPERPESAALPAPSTAGAPVENEAADPVGDGHSDAELAAVLPPPPDDKASPPA